MLSTDQLTVKVRQTCEIHHLIWTGGVLDCFRGCDGAPCRGWIPAFAGMTEMGDFETCEANTASLPAHSRPDWRGAGRVQVEVRRTWAPWSEESWRACMASRTW